MEHIHIGIEDGNVNITQNCTPDTFMSATIIMVASMALNSSNTLEELLEIIQKEALLVIEKSALKILEKEAVEDAV